LAIFGAISNLGSSLMDISVGFDLAVDVLPEKELTLFNSRLKRLDLLTEVSAPVFAGLAMTLLHEKSGLYGFSLIALLNVLTFIPEYYLLSSIQSLRDYKEKIVSLPKSKNFLVEFYDSLKKLRGKSYAIVIVSYAFLWFSVLSPHGVLLTSYLKDGAKASEFTIGVFRGAGALFGLIPTFLFAFAKEKFGLIKASRSFILFQFICVLLSVICFYKLENIYVFLMLILFSRIGLYGFSIGETELRQVLIPKEKRGEVNGIANSITGMATVGLFFMGSFLGDTANFGTMIIISVTAVFISLLLFIRMKESEV
jgi:iron-regulated transporter 1